MASILVIDDDAQMRVFLQRLLEGEGHDVRVARHGREGIRVFQERPADLILCDIFMPEEDGLGTIRMLRQKSPEVKIVAMSGGSSRFARDYLPDALTLGARATLAKPFARDTLLQAVQSVLQT